LVNAMLWIVSKIDRDLQELRVGEGITWP
jgi:hypothetical protein